MTENASAKLQVELGLTDNASSKTREVGGVFHQLGDELKQIGQIAAGVTLGNFGAQIGMSISEHFKDALTEVQNFGEQVFQLQQRLGMSSQSASGILSVFERFGVSSDESARSLDFFSRGLRRQIDATEGGSEALGNFQGTLAELGVRATDAAGNFRPVDQVLADVVDRMHALGGDGQTAARAMALFGRAGADLAPVLNLSKQDFMDLQAEAQRLGVTLSQDNVDQIRQLAMAHHDLDEATRGLSIQTGLLVTGPLTKLAEIAATVAGGFNEKIIPAIKHAESEYQVWQQLVAKQINPPGPSDQKPPLSPLTRAQIEQPGNQSITNAQGQPDSAFNVVVKPLLDQIGNALAQAGSGLDTGDNGGALPPGGAILKGIKNLLPVTTIANDIGQAHADAARQLASGSNLPFNQQGVTGNEPESRKLAQQQADAQSRATKQLNLDQAELAANRAMEVAQFQINQLQQDRLDLVKASAQAELNLIPIKERQAELNVQLLASENQRAQIQRDTAVQRAQLAGLPSSAALEENQYQQQLIQAQVKAGIASGHGIPAGALRDLMGLERAAPELELNSLEAGHDVTLAQRAQQAGQLQTQINTAPVREAQADNAIQMAQAQAALDQVANDQRATLLGKTDDLIALEQQRRDVEKQQFEISQRKQDLGGALISNVQLTVNEANGQLDYGQLVKDLASVVLDSIKKATGRTEAPAPAFAPGAVG